MAPKKSLIWEHYHFITISDEAKCLLCGKKFAAKQGSTKGLWDHLERKHNSVYAELKSDETLVKKRKEAKASEKKNIYQLNEETDESLSPSTASTSSSQVSRQRQPSGQTSMDRFCGPLRQAPHVDRLIFSWLADATLPYKTVDNPQFRLLIDTLTQLPYKYILPHEGKIRLSVGPKVIEALEWKIRQIMLNDVDFYCFDTDIWISSTQNSYLSFVVHFIDSKWSRKMCVLRCKPIYSQHTAENINSELIDIRNEWGLDNSVLHLAVRDSAANMVAAMRIGQVDDANCFLHLLNLVVTKGIMAQRMVKDMIARAADVVNDFTYKG